jgi:hypothetical protein
MEEVPEGILKTVFDKVNSEDTLGLIPKSLDNFNH